MRPLAPFLCAVFFLMIPRASAQNSPPPQATSPAAPNQNAESELQKAVNSAGIDRAALVRNLQDFLRRFPDAPQKAQVYHALIDACADIRDDTCTLDSAEHLIAIQPDDSQTLMVAVELLQKKGDEASLTLASTYLTHVIDRTENTASLQRPERLSLVEWQDRRAQLLLGLYLIRGDIQNQLHHLDAAVKDYQASFSARANPSAAEALGDIAETRNDLPGAVQQYLLAFVLPDIGPRKVDRREVRTKLGNVWQQIHGSQQGLGEEILAAYDRTAPTAPDPNSIVRNPNAKNVFDFVLRRLDGTPYALAPLKGKIIVLSFWATWCAPCRELEPELAKIAKSYSQNSDVVFLAVNADEEQSLVPDFLQHVKWDLDVAFSDGLSRFLGVTALPTVMVLDRNGKIAYNAAGFPEHGFTESLTAAVESARQNHP
jgi:thiol-disulfide isomerase/thioredoxin